MKVDELKQLIRAYTRQYLNEALAEKYLQNIVKEAVRESFKEANVLKESKETVYKPSMIAEEVVRPRSQPQPKEDVVRKKAEQVSKVLGENDPIMKQIFEETLKSDNPILSYDPNGKMDATAGEEVSEELLEKAGVFSKDWSKFV